jgi:hypothetical protein
MSTTRKAVVLSKSSALETVQRYLPGNYEAQFINGFVVITGQDNAGWTLDDYVIPRLASGLHTAIEVRYLETEEEHEELFNSGPTPEYGRDYFTGPFGDVLVPVK